MTYSLYVLTSSADRGLLSLYIQAPVNGLQRTLATKGRGLKTAN
jgi:hypothetical protein